ncbi:hypothetical protein [Rhizobium mongolense]|uniref:Uncharacterized protein n=2 Tax=Rhizobium mongolense TaxID=57676 RepID=A0ABR6IQ67_9HYPH|nr:hypothetical protein [Rhizobium mongolense]MBB4230034.1 hypothetical protein [Rhizobium mongolense]TVZ72834.1 hypothetical protein BCL32_1021 [Rhizobium mongolense USDA 1844]
MTTTDEFTKNLDETLNRLREYLAKLEPEERPGQWVITYIGAPRYFQVDEVK